MMQTSDLWIWQQSAWPQFSWQQDKLSPALARARLAQGKILGATRLLDTHLTHEAIASILVEDGLTTSAIEGEQLNLDAVRSSVARHLGLPTVGLPTPARAVDGLIEVLLDATQHYSAPLTIERLLGWQAALFPNGYSVLHPVRSGVLRGDAPMQVVSGRIGHERVHFIAPPRLGLELELARFLTWFNAEAKSDGLIRAGLAHLWFVTLHPFEDGNGRLARAITDMALAQDEGQSMRFFSLSAQILRERENYYVYLERTQRGNLDVTEWLVWFLTQIEAAATAAQHSITNTLAKARFWLHHQASSLNQRQHKVLNRLLDAGSGFEGGINTRKYMSLTKTSRATAYRELNELVAKGCLTSTGKGGRSTSYEIIYPCDYNPHHSNDL